MSPPDPSFSPAGPSRRVWVLSMADSVEFSTDGTDFTHVTSTPVDSAVTHVRFRSTGTFNANDAGDKPGFVVSFLAEVR